MIRTALMFVAVAVSAILMFVLIVWSSTIPPQERRIDCTWSEISPDFSNAMREACRKARQQ
jgi:hypothetical protein